jgi:choline dehydrogenase-like flavoprotein
MSPMHDLNVMRVLNRFQKYYQPNESRENLTIVVSSYVTKIGTELDENGRATAVEVVFMSDETVYTVRVGKEVILSAG